MVSELIYIAHIYRENSPSLTQLLPHLCRKLILGVGLRGDFFGNFAPLIRKRESVYPEHIIPQDNTYL